MLEQLGRRMLQLRRLLPWLVALLALSGLLLLKSCGSSGDSSLLTSSGIPSTTPTMSPVSGTPQPVPTNSLPPTGSTPSGSTPTQTNTPSSEPSTPPLPTSSPESTPTPAAGSTPSGSTPTPTSNPSAQPGTPPSPTSSPVSTPGGGSTPPGIPAGNVVILNGEQIDGAPTTLGQILSLQARANGLAGNDSSEQIEWRNAEGSLLGRGSRLEYSAQSVKMETLSARVGSAQDRVSSRK